MSNIPPSEKPAHTQRGLPPVRKPHPPVVKPPLPTQAQRDALRRTPPLYAVPAAATPGPGQKSGGQKPLCAAATSVGDVQRMLLHAKLVGGKEDLDSLAKRINGSDPKKEIAGRVEFLEIMVGGAVYRIYDMFNNLASNEKYAGELVATLEYAFDPSKKAELYFMYVDSAKSPWPA